MRHGLMMVGQTVSADQLVRLISHRAGLAGQLLLCRLESDQDSSITEAETTRRAIPALRRAATSVALVVPLAVTQVRSRRRPWPPSLRLLTRPRSGIPRPWNRPSSSRLRWSIAAKRAAERPHGSGRSAVRAGRGVSLEREQQPVSSVRAAPSSCPCWGSNGHLRSTRERAVWRSRCPGVQGGARRHRTYAAITSGYPRESVSCKFASASSQ